MEASLCFALLVFFPAFTSTVVLPQKRSAQERGSDLEIYSFHVDCKVTSRFAHNVLTSRMANRANASREVTFDVELPKHAFISNFSMTIDGKTYVGVVKKKEEAKQQYDQAVSRGHSAGLVKVSGRKMEEFKVSVNIAALSKVTFELTYEELLKRHLGKYELAIKVRPQQLVKHFKIDAHIYEPQGISFLDVHAAFLTNDLAETVKKTLTQDKAHVVFEPTLDQQRKCPECSESILDGEFIIKYDVKREASAGDIQIVNGYFVHYFAPTDLPRMRKNVVFVIDRSGSMHGKKMQQTREALLKILEDIHEDDHFGLITFDSEVSTWKSTLVQATPEMVQQAKTFVGRITDRGVTDINAAVLKGVEMLKISKEERKLPERSVSIIILLTDGDPTSGVTNLEQIQSNIKKGIEGLYTLYCLGFGFDVNYNFLEKLALENGGVARRIYESSDSALQLQGFYEEVATPLLQQVELQYPGNGVSDLTENVFRHYYNGSEIVVAGRISKNDLEILSVQIKAGAASSDLTLAAETPVEEQDEAVKKHKYIFGEYIERLWAYLTIEQLLSKIVSAQPEEREALNEKALQLSLNYNFVTSLTSMVVTKPEEGQTDRTMVAHKPTEAEQGDRLDFSHHGGGFGMGAAGVPFGPGDPLGRPQGGGFGMGAAGVPFGPGDPLGRPQGGGFRMGVAGVPFGPGYPLGRPQGGGFGMGAAGVPFGPGDPLGRPQGGGFGMGAAGVPFGPGDPLGRPQGGGFGMGAAGVPFGPGDPLGRPQGGGFRMGVAGVPFGPGYPLGRPQGGGFGMGAAGVPFGPGDPLGRPQGGGFGMGAAGVPFGPGDPLGRPQGGGFGMGAAGVPFGPGDPLGRPQGGGFGMGAAGVPFGPGGPLGRPQGGGFGMGAAGVPFGPGDPLGRPQGGGFGMGAAGVPFGPGDPLGRPQGGGFGMGAAGVPFGPGDPLGRPQGGGFGMGAAGVPFGPGDPLGRPQAPFPTHTAQQPTHAADENPQFVIPVKNKQRSVCFEITAPSDGVILQLVSDADSGITINGELGEAGKSAFQKIGIVYKDLYEIEFNTQGLSLVNKTDNSIQTLSWSPMNIVSDSLSLSSSNGRTTEVTLGSTVIEVLLHRSRQDFLWLKIKLNDFSAGSTGLLGRFSRQLYVKEGRIGSKVLIEVYGHDVTVTRDFTIDYGTLSKDRVSCWVVPDGGRGAIDGSYSDYVVQTLFQKP
ncbi:inter-alpha-trypsin inhibitor heavy chain H3-like isoform X8 [Acipenser ruthenus]|uniref:inter-alpha-trypsin inhibitor heavy chain H3-like isoform X8 n=1 Tax=Acipenser ruthenus TaxID=7906 RepID=UPI002740F1C0|nr:inter-alpha-trypsin inhibitor heavy chain H3-like isoform X8 [Acipenser ruthenus]